nr:unnamed protein product [Ipomoea batatas]
MKGPGQEDLTTMADAATEAASVNNGFRRGHDGSNLISQLRSGEMAHTRLFHVFLVEIAFLIAAGSMFFRRMPGLEEQDDEYDVSDDENQPGADQGDGDSPEILAGEFESRNVEVSGNPTDYS